MALDLKIHSFNAGVWSPHLDGRSDLEKYYSACRMMDNMIPLPYGDAERRPGTYYVAELKDSSKKARLIPFQYSTEQAYILEYGDQYIRFCKDRGQIQSGIGTEDLSAFDSAVGDSTLLAHWLLNDNLATNDVLDDAIAGTYDGSMATGNTEDVHATGKVGTGCFNLGGANAVEVNDAAGLSFDDSGDNPFSIAVWGRVTTTGTRQVILSKWKSGSLREYRLSLDSDLKLELALCDDSVALDTALVAHWKLNDNAANTAVDDDVAAVPHDGVASANTNTLHATGRVGTGCFNLGGAANALVNDHAALSFDDTADENMSITAWIYVTNTGTDQVILGKWGDAKREWKLHLLANRKLQFALYDDNANQGAERTTDAALTEGWHFVAGAYDNADAAWTAATAANFITLYVDDAAADSTATNNALYAGMQNDTAKVGIGGNDAAQPQYFADKIDEIALFNKALSAVEFATLYNGGVGAEDVDGTFPYRISDDAVTEGWHLFAATYDSTGGATAADGIVLFVDGAAVDSTAHNESTYVAMENTATKLRIGASENSAGTIGYVWADKIDNAALFTEHLTAVNIASLYSTGAYEVSSSYLEADLFGLQRTQSADVLFNVHGSYPPSKLMRYAHDDWELADIVFDWPPFLDENNTDITITPTNGTPPLAVGTSVTLAASSAIFTSNHVGSYWLIKHPRTADETVAPNKVGSTEADDILNASGELTDILKDVKGSWRFRTAGIWSGQILIERSYDDGTSWHTLQTLVSNDTEEQNFNISGNEELGDAWFRAKILDNGSIAVAGACEPTLSVERFYHYGIVKITAFTSSTVVTAEVIRAINSESATKLWSEGAWSDERGYPVTSEFFDGRQYFAGTRHKPLNIWGSRIDDYENMGIGTLDDDPVKFPVDSGMQNIIRWLVSQETLLIGTSGGEWKLGSSDPAEGITPTSPIRPRKQTTYGSKEIQALLLANVVLFVSGSGTDDKGRAVRGAQYIFEKGEAGGYDAPDYTLFAEHITESGIVGMAYQQKPYPILWAWLDDGTLVGMVFEPGQKVWGWFRCVIDGFVESVAVIPGVTEDEVWIIVRRIKGDGTVIRCIEYFKPRDWGSDQADCFFVDSGLTFNGGDAVSITGITKADPAVVTMGTYPTDGDGNNIADGDQVKIIGVAGMTEVNTKVFTVSNPNVSAKTFELRDKLDTVDIDSTGFTLFNSSITGDIEYDSYTVKNVSAADIAKLAFRTTVSGTGIPSSTTITAINTDSFTMSNKALITNTSVTITAQGTVMKVDNAFSGLDHLEGKTVSVLGDGSVHADVIVSSGAITLTDYYNKVHAGLPFKSKLMPMKPEIQTQTGSARAKQKRIHQLAFSFYKTLGAKFGPTRGEDTIPFRKTTDSMGSPPPLFTGEKIQTFPGGYEISGDIYVEQTQPLPLTVRSIIARLQIYG